MSTKVATYAALAALLFGAALAAREPQLLALGAPFAVALAYGLVLTGRPAVTVTTEVTPDRTTEGDPVELVVTLTSDVDVDRLELVWPLPPGLRYAESVDMPHAVRLAAGVPRELRYPVDAERWGAYPVGGGVVRYRGPLGFTTFEQVLAPAGTLRVYPAVENLRHLPRPSEATLAAGALVSRRPGPGFEFADIRAFVPGDRVRDVNWRATARRGELRVNDRHPERSTDVVLLVDAFGGAALPAAVRAAVSLARTYLRERDRVGVVSFGGMLRWLQPGLGYRQLYRIVDALIESAGVYSYAWKALDQLPPQALPAGAILLAVTPLADERTVSALVDRAGRGTDLAVVRVALDAYAEPGPTAADRLGHAMWRLELDRVTDRLRERGVAVASWSDDAPLDAALEEVIAFRRHARPRVG